MTPNYPPVIPEPQRDPFTPATVAPTPAPVQDQSRGQSQGGFTAEQIDTLKGLFGNQAPQHEAAPELTDEQKAEQARREYTLKAGRPDVDPDAGPDYYVHLANGDVVTSKDSGSTAMGVDGETVAVIGRYMVHPKTGEA